MDGFSADVEDSTVEEMLAICSEESLLKLSLNTHTISSSSDSLLLDSDLLARLHKLKTPPPPIPTASQPSPPPVDPQEIDILGAHLASRLAALKQPSLRPSPPVPEHPELPALPPPIDSSALNAPDARCRRNKELNRVANSESASDASEVDKLLASVSDQVRLEKTNALLKAKLSDDDAADELKDSEEEASDSDVDEMVEWAKDAARLDIRDDEEHDADPVLDEEVRDESTPSPSNCAHETKKTSKRWKFW